jgi:hypothetical protein
MPSSAGTTPYQREVSQNSRTKRAKRWTSRRAPSESPRASELSTSLPPWAPGYAIQIPRRCCQSPGRRHGSNLRCKSNKRTGQLKPHRLIGKPAPSLARAFSEVVPFYELILAIWVCAVAFKIDTSADIHAAAKLVHGHLKTMILTNGCGTGKTVTYGAAIVHSFKRF